MWNRTTFHVINAPQLQKLKIVDLQANLGACIRGVSEEDLQGVQRRVEISVALELASALFRFYKGCLQSSTVAFPTNLCYTLRSAHSQRSFKRCDIITGARTCLRWSRTCLQKTKGVEV